MKRITNRQLGYLFGIKAQRNYLRNEAKARKKELKNADDDLKTFGIFSDCGSTYEAIYERQDAIFKHAVKMKIEIEKFYKKEKLRLCEKNEELREFINILERQSNTLRGIEI